MLMERTLLLCMRSWGSMGNYNSTVKLAETVGDALGDQRVIAFDEIVPEFCTFGERLAVARKQTTNSGSVRSTYDDIMGECASWLSSTNPAIDRAFERLRQLLLDYAPDVIICSKGVITNVINDLVPSMGLNDLQVVNYLTNHGLLRSPIHKVSNSNPQLCVCDDAVDALLKMGIQPENVLNIGYPPTEPRLGERHQLRHSPSVIIFDNNGGEEYPALVAKLEVAGLHAGVLTTNVEKYARFREKLAFLVGPMPLSSYLGLLKMAREAGAVVLIMKAGPNAVFEAVGLNIPVIALPSGLPGEEWVADFIDKHDLGQVCASADEAASSAIHLLSNDSKFETVSTKLTALATRLFKSNQGSTVKPFLQARWRERTYE